MSRKKKAEDINWDEFVLDRFSSFFDRLDPKDVALCLIFIYAMWNGWGKTPLPTKEDVMMGILLGLTIPPALQGGIIANGYAVGAMGALGFSQFTSGTELDQKFGEIMDLASQLLPGGINPADLVKLMG